jgi:hypothetical protein
MAAISASVAASAIRIQTEVEPDVRTVVRRQRALRRVAQILSLGIRGFLLGIAILLVGLDVETLEAADRIDGRAAAAVGLGLVG